MFHNSDILSWPALAALTGLLVIIQITRTTCRKGLRTLPGPFLAKFSSLYRISLVAGGGAAENYRKLHQKYGRIVRTGPNHVSVSDPSTIPVIYGTGSRFTKSAFYSTMSPSFHGRPLDSMFSTRDPAYHKALKVPVAQLFSVANMRNFEIYADECTAIFMDAMADLTGQPLDLAIWLQWYAFDVIAGLTFQRRFGFLERREDVDGMIESIDTGLQLVKLLGQVPSLAGYITKLLLLVFPMPIALTSFIEITQEEIRRYDEQGQLNERTDFLAQLRAKEAKDGHITDRDMINHLSNNLLAGSDTTAISLRSCFYYLIKNPPVYQKLVAEIDEADSRAELSEIVTFQESMKLPYLQAVIREAMRIHPGVAFPLERLVPEEGGIICGVKLPAGTNVSISAPVIHVDEEIFGPDAQLFRPERWLDASPEQLKAMNRSFLSFGHGARICIGKNISFMEMGKFIPQILRHYELEWASPNREWKTHAAWFWKQSELIVKFKHRQKN